MSKDIGLLSVIISWIVIKMELPPNSSLTVYQKFDEIFIENLAEVKDAP